MDKKKKSKIIIITLVVLIIAMILGVTYSKYIQSVPVSGSATTANWSFDAAISNTSNTATKAISLADTVNKSSVRSGKIAPGTSGSFKIILNASCSDVDVGYDILLNGTESNKPENLYFTCESLVKAKDSDNNLIKYYSLSDMLAYDEEAGKYNLSGVIPRTNNGSAKEVVINWEWPYESTRTGKTQAQLDKQDTDDSGIVDYSFALNIVGKQVN